jgi:MerR family transcriptional regulator, light-induced transcriptional regulator
MLEEMFQREGWSTRSCRNGDLADLQEAAASRRFDIIALTMSIDAHSGAIATLVAALRHSSRNPDVRIMVGGKIFNDRPGLAEAVGADATAADARAALKKADLLVEQAHVEHLVSHLSGSGSGSAYAHRRSAPG